VTQSVGHLTLDFGSGHDLRAMRSSPMLGSALDTEHAWDSLSLCPPPPLLLSPRKKKKQLKRIKIPKISFLMKLRPLNKNLSHHIKTCVYIMYVCVRVFIS